MTDNEDNVDNVVLFAPRAQPVAVPRLEFVSLRLVSANCGIVMEVVDEAGNVVVLQYALVSAPETFDLDRLREAWSRWRGSSTGVAS